MLLAPAGPPAEEEAMEVVPAVATEAAGPREAVATEAVATAAAMEAAAVVATAVAAL